MGGKPNPGTKPDRRLKENGGGKKPPGVGKTLPRPPYRKK